MQGYVKWFNSVKGFGFIEQDSGEPDAFVHYSNILDSGDFRELQDGDRVTYEVEPTPKGPSAVSVLKIIE